MPVPEFGLMLNQAALELAVQGTLEVTEAMKLPAALPTDLELGLMVNIGAVFVACVMVTVLVSKPEVMVMTPVRMEPVFAAWVTVTVPFPEPKD